MSPAPDKVDFLGIGAARSGTSWIAEALRGHPRIYLPDRKEVHYFNEITYESPGKRNPNFDRPISWYLRNFKAAKPGQLVGEISPTYLWDESAAVRIWEHNREVLLLAILRDPVSALASQCRYRIQRGAVRPAPLDDVLRQLWFLVDRHRYGRHLSRYFDLFDRDLIRVLLYEDLLESGEMVAQQLFEFLGVDSVALHGLAASVNVSGQPRYPRFNRIVERTRTTARNPGLEPLVDALRTLGVGRVVQRFRDQTVPFGGDPPELSPALIMELRQKLRPDIELLETLTDRDLTHWKT